MKASEVLKIKAKELNNESLLKVAEDLSATKIDFEVFSKTALLNQEDKPAESSPQAVIAAPDPAGLPNEGTQEETPLLIDSLIATMTPTPESQPGPSINAGSQETQEAMAKQAGLGTSLLQLGGKLIQNPTVRNAAIGAGIGAVAGAAAAPQGQGLKGALKGGLIGSAAGGLGTAAAKGVASTEFQAAKGVMPKLTALKNVAGKDLASAGTGAINAYQSVFKPKTT